METIIPILAILAHGVSRRSLLYASNNRLEKIDEGDPEAMADWDRRWSEYANEEAETEDVHDDLDELARLRELLTCPVCNYVDSDQGGWYCHCTEAKPGSCKERWFFGKWAQRVEGLRLNETSGG